MTVTERIADLSTIWKQASIVFPYFDRRRVDWDAAYMEYLPKVMAAESETRFHLILAEFVNLLGDGHTGYTLPRRLIEETGTLPFSLMHLSGDYYIRAIEAGGERHLLAKIIGINGTPFDELLAEAFRCIYHVGDYAYPSHLHRILPFLLKPAGNVMETSAGEYRFDLAKSAPTLVECKLPDVTTLGKNISNGKLDIRLYSGNILYAKLDDCQYGGAADEIAAALGAHGNLKGVILDVRENIGGMTLNGAKVAELFISGEFSGCRKRTRVLRGNDIGPSSQIVRMSEARLAELGVAPEEIERSRRVMANEYCEEYVDKFGAPEHRAVFDGDCILLTSRNTISAAEDFVAMFRSNDRATIIGTPTCGTTGTPYLRSLACGGGLRICTVGYQLLDGTEFIGCGIKPDVYAEIGIGDYVTGADNVLELALSRLA